MEPRTLVAWNRQFVYVSAGWASLSGEFGIRQGPLAHAVNKLTLAWSALIFATSLVKILMRREQQEHLLQKRQPPEQEVGESNLQALLLLDYLPNIGAYASLYYGLMLVTIGAPFVWRLYLTYYKPLHRHHPLARALANQLLQFLLEGPPELQDGHDKQLAHHHRHHQHHHLKGRPLSHQESQRWLHWVERLVRSRHRRASSNRSWLFSARSSDTWLDAGPLSLAHRPHNLHDKSAHLNEVFRNPIRSNDLLFDNSYQHWLYLVRAIYGLMLFAFVVSVPLLWYILHAFVQLMTRFSVPTGSRTAFQWYMVIYGYCELAYAYTQASMFFVFTNIFMGVFYADLSYKMKPMKQSLIRLKSSYCRWPGALVETKEQARVIQLKLWAYFDNIDQLDHLVSKYSLVSIVTFVSGLCFAQSYISMNDTIITHGAIATFLANFISFNFLYVLSWRIETQSTKVHGTLLSIVAREPNFVAKRGWQRTIFGFYQLDRKRTFTMDGQYPLNPRSLIKINFALLTISLLINKLFYD